MNNPDSWQNPKRQEATLRMLQSASPVLPAIDMGESSFTQRLADALKIEIAHTNFDLDYGQIEGKWGTILSFEVVEHLGNPLHHLKNMKEALLPGGSIFLSTPLVARWRPDSFRAGNHVFEFSRPQLEFLLHKAGLQTIQREEFLYRKTWQYFRGPRPLLRLFSDRCVLLQLQAAE
jgi:2-polyprenyl-3-methyl-5-hydroxy-6-metoxy-1,4-benzoquinol methylase